MFPYYPLKLRHINQLDRKNIYPYHVPKGDLLDTNSLFITCTRYLEPLLAEELRSLGADDLSVVRAGVSCRGDLETAYRICLWSRIAGRVLLSLSDFECSTEQEIYEGSRTVRWEDHFSPDKTFMVDATLLRTFMKNENYAALKVKDAIADRFRDKDGRRPSVDTERPDIRINLHAEGRKASLYLDMSGESLFKRGYRLEATEAPLRENSAAAMLMKAGWQEGAGSGGTSHTEKTAGLKEMAGPDLKESAGEEIFFLDPMCGSGTLVIEAGLMAADCAPGLLRDRYGFQAWEGHDHHLWERLREEARVRRETGLQSLPPLFASDIDPKAVRITRENIRRAGLEGRVRLSTGDFRSFDRSNLPGGRAFIAVNPPYGVRLERGGEVNGLYRDLGRWMADNFAQGVAAVLAPDKETSRYIGLRADKVNTFYNGSLKIVLATLSLGDKNVYGEYDPKRPRVRMKDDETTGIRMIVNRINRNKKMLKKYLDRHGISCYRIYDADIPQYSAAIDIYEDTYAVVQEYAPPKTIDPKKAALRLEEIIAAVPHCFPIETGNIFLKQRKRQKGARQYQKQDRRGELIIVRENGLKFFVNFSDYLDTGIFLDHRLTRQLIRDRSKGAQVLNLFAYTCTASVYAAAGGAVRTVSVDTSTTYLEWGKKNFGLNRIPMDGHLFQRQDSIEFLRSDLGLYDLVFIDPPTFSNRKGAENVFDVQRDHKELIDLAGRRLSPEGTIIFSNNYRRFILDSAIEELYTVEEISADTIPADFERNAKIHRTWLIRAKGQG